MVKYSRGIITLLLVLLLAGCGTVVEHVDKGSYVVYTVKPGDTLYSISWRYGHDHREVAAWNKIRYPYKIYPDQELVIITSLQARQNGSRVQSPNNGGGSATSPQKKSKPATASPSSRPVAGNSRSDKTRSKSANRKIVWQWPVKGELKAKFNPAKGDKGVDIKGAKGQSVFAAASGEVVYSGKGLIGYGNLIIIKHNDTYLSAYGHNRRLLAREGQKIKKGEKIAEMGSTNKDGAILHFEIRKRGKPINPLWYLPK